MVFGDVIRDTGETVAKALQVGTVGRSLPKARVVVRQTQMCLTKAIPPSEQTLKCYWAQWDPQVVEENLKRTRKKADGTENEQKSFFRGRRGIIYV